MTPVQEPQAWGDKLLNELRRRRVFRVATLPALTPNHEVDDVVWVPLHFLMDSANREPLAWEWKGQNMETDSYLYQSYRIWGLSLMMIDEMLSLLTH